MFLWQRDILLLLVCVFVHWRMFWSVRILDFKRQWIHVMVYLVNRTLTLVHCTSFLEDICISLYKSGIVYYILGKTVTEFRHHCFTFDYNYVKSSVYTLKMLEVALYSPHIASVVKPVHFGQVQLRCRIWNKHIEYYLLF